MVTERPIADILRDAKVIAAEPRSEVPKQAFPCVVSPSLDDVDEKHVSLVVVDGFPVFVYPKGTRPDREVENSC